MIKKNESRQTELQAAASLWVTDLGAWYSGERVVFRGQDLLNDLAPIRWMDLLMFGITKRRLPDKQLDLLEQIWSICVSYPDPRLWNNRIAALAATTRSTPSLAIGAASAITEAKVYGGQANYRSICFMQQATRVVLDDETKLRDFVFKWLKQKRYIAGYGRPLVDNDERIEPLLKYAGTLGLTDGEHLKTALLIRDLLQSSRYRLHINITGVAAALAADMGLSPREYQTYLTLAFSAGILPCYVDSIEHPQGTFFPFPIDTINYKGKSPRNWDS